MKQLTSVNPGLSEDTRIQTIYMKGEVFDLHQGSGDNTAYYITEHGEPRKIYLAASKELWNLMFA